MGSRNIATSMHLETCFSNDNLYKENRELFIKCSTKLIKNSLNTHPSISLLSALKKDELYEEIHNNKKVTYQRSSAITPNTIILELDISINAPD